MPALNLPGLEGEPQKLADLFGEKLTVVVFWSNSNRLGREQISRLSAETAGPFASLGVRVVAVNVGDPPEQILDLLPAEGERDFAVLLDETGEAFSKVATSRLPRMYVLDTEGRILWLDLEYSRSSRRDLLNALHFFLKQAQTSDS